MDNRGFRIKDIHAYISVGPDDEEGVCAIMINGIWIPMVAADAKRLEQLKPEAQRIATISGLTIKLVRFAILVLVKPYI